MTTLTTLAFPYVRLAVIIVAILTATFAFAYATLAVIVAIIATLAFPSSSRGGERCVIKDFVSPLSWFGCRALRVLSLHRN
jgi:hypothetical protein